MAILLRVPEQYEEGIAKIRDLSDESTRELLAALQDPPSTFNEFSLSSAVAQKVDTIAASDVEEIVPALLSLYSYRDYSQSAISEVAEGIAQAMSESASEQLKISSGDFDLFTGRLVELLSVEPLNVAVRAGMLSLENEHSLQDARVLTDLRPIFEPENPEKPPKGAVILHTLKISYRGDNRIKNFFVTLDTEDMRMLLEQLERANLKAQSLKSILKAAQVPHIDAK